MSLTNEQLTESIKINKYEKLSEVLIVVKEMLKDGLVLNDTNEQLIRATFNLKNIKELNERINNFNGNQSEEIIATIKFKQQSNSNTKKESKVLNVDTEEELDEFELVSNLNNIFIDFKSGFGLILVSNCFLVLSSLVSSFAENISTLKAVIYINIISYVIFLIGIIILYRASELKKDAN